jgi:hypothetical protein
LGEAGEFLVHLEKGVSEESEFAGVSLDLFVFGNEEVVEGSKNICYLWID